MNILYYGRWKTPNIEKPLETPFTLLQNVGLGEDISGDTIHTMGLMNTNDRTLLHNSATIKSLLPSEAK